MVRVLCELYPLTLAGFCRLCSVVFDKSHTSLSLTTVLVRFLFGGYLTFSRPPKQSGGAMATSFLKYSLPANQGESKRINLF